MSNNKQNKVILTHLTIDGARETYLEIQNDRGEPLGVCLLSNTDKIRIAQALLNDVSGL
jgi:hypothetical protein